MTTTMMSTLALKSKIVTLVFSRNPVGYQNVKRLKLSISSNTESLNQSFYPGPVSNCDRILESIFVRAVGNQHILY